MSNEDIIRAWKDPEYRNSLSEEQRSQLPENPAGMIELGDAEMETLAGGINFAFAYPQTFTVGTEQCCSSGHFCSMDACFIGI